jgi:hypothetical protein
MSDLKNDPKVQPGSKGKGAPDDAADSQLVQRDADEMADKAEEEEDRFDEDHGIFTK